MSRRHQRKTLKNFIQFIVSAIFLGVALVVFQYVDSTLLNYKSNERSLELQIGRLGTFLRSNVDLANDLRKKKEIDFINIQMKKSEVFSHMIAIEEAQRQLVSSYTVLESFSILKEDLNLLDKKTNKEDVLNNLINLNHSISGYLEDNYNAKNQTVNKIETYSNARIYTEGLLVLSSLVCVWLLMNLMMSVMRENRRLAKEGENYKANILLVDDEEDVLSVLEINSSTSKKFRFFRASDGIEALDMLSKNDIDMVIADISMPNMNGIELASKIKKKKDVEVVLMTSFQDIKVNEDYYSKETKDNKHKIYDKFEILTDVDGVISERLDLGIVG